MDGTFVPTLLSLNCVTSNDSPDTPTSIAALVAPSRLRDTLSKESSFQIIWDSGASGCISHDIDDFVGDIDKPESIRKLTGLAKGLAIAGTGHAEWAIPDEFGNHRVLHLPAYYVPKANVRLLSTTSFAQAYPGEKYIGDHTGIRVTGIANDPNRGPIHAMINPANNLPMSTAYRANAVQKGSEILANIISTVNENNTNLSEPEKELLRWHQRLGHLSFKKIQFLMRTGVLAHTEKTRRLHTAAAKLTVAPKCAACRFGKQLARTTPSTTHQQVRSNAGALKKENLTPGQYVSVDHFICSTKGRAFNTRGKTTSNESYTGGCLFVDQATNFIHIEFQAHLNTHETLKAKEGFELMCRDVGVIPQGYLSDNGSSFTAAEYTKQLRQFEQVTRFAGTCGKSMFFARCSCATASYLPSRVFFHLQKNVRLRTGCWSSQLSDADGILKSENL